MEISEGRTPDISIFCFHFWGPIWYYVPGVKAPDTPLKKGRWLGITSSSGDLMTYYIQTEKEPDEGRDVILVRSVLKSRRKNIGEPNEYINDDPQYAEFNLTDMANDDSGEFNTEIDIDTVGILLPSMASPGGKITHGGFAPP